MTKYPHILGANAIEEITLHVYKYPKSGIKEAISNGLDEQGSDARIEINYIPYYEDNLEYVDIEIIDWGGGIQDFDEFRKFLKGYKKVGTQISSYKQNNPNLIGNKGAGKYAILGLSGANPPTVIFYSHGEDVGMIITMTTDLETGFDMQPKDTEKVLAGHTGVRVLIKKAKMELLPKENILLEFIQKNFIRRIHAGAKIYLNEKQIQLPSSYDPREFSLFKLSDGTVIKGNIHKLDKWEPDNIDVLIKDVFVESFSYDYKCKGWLNDNLIIPTTSRESIQKDKRFEEIEQKLYEYLDANFEKPGKDTNFIEVNSAEIKEQVTVQLLLLNDMHVKGYHDPNSSIYGEILDDYLPKKNKVKKIKENDYELLDKGGSDKGIPIIPIGTGIRNGGIRTNGTGNNPTAIKGGNHPVLIDPNDDKNKDEEIKEGPIKPKITMLWVNRGLQFPPAEQEDDFTIKMNLAWPQTIAAMKGTGKNALICHVPLVTAAIVNYNAKIKSETLDPFEWQIRFNNLVKAGLEKQ
jgi:hypothetical protein